MFAVRIAALILFVAGCSRGPVPGRTPVAAAAISAIAPPAPPHFGMNLASVEDWSREWAFVDVFKNSRPWIEKGPKPFAYDAHGWPIISPGQSVETLMVRELDGHYPAGRDVATWSGNGTVDVPGFDISKVISRKAKPNRIRRSSGRRRLASHHLRK